jgi:alpha-beta hydrolase superfamily lysophospholipase
MKRFTRKRIIKAIAILGGIYIAGGVALYLFQDKLIFHPQSLPADHRFNFSYPYEEINLPIEGRNLNIVRFKTAAAPKGAVLYFHGNMRNIERYADITPLFTNNGYEVWMMDYPGFGKSTGKRSEEVLHADARRVYELALNEYAPERMIIYGRSIGTGIASGLAAEKPCKMLILETPYYNMDALAKSYFPVYPVMPLTNYSLRTNEYLKKNKAPAYIIHGTEDEVVPYSQSKRLKKENPSLHLITIPEGRHNNLAEHSLFRATLTRLLFLD